ncbi:MAG: alkaline phosphatase D family protein [Thermomicrobiales bacterium]
MQYEKNFPDGLLDHSVEVGAVTDRAARVWFRLPGDSSPNGSLAIDGQIVARASTTNSDVHDWTGTLDFELDEPVPGATFSIDVGGTIRQGRFAPSPDQPTGLTFGFGSCNRPFKPRDGEVVYHQAAGIYDALIEDFHRADARFSVLVGDQIYSDELDPISVRGIATEDDRIPTLDEAVESYRKVSRGYLGVPGFLKLRQQFPSLTIWDDHDIFDNWGSRKEVSDLDQRLFDAATKVYAEYQHARNPGPRKDGPPFHYWFKHGNVGFIVLDIRGKRDWNSGKLIGAEQWKDVVDFIEGPESEGIASLFVVTSVPVAHVARWMSKLLEPVPGKLGDSVRDRWTTDAFCDQRNDLLDLLFGWQTGAPGRQVAILSGDVHVAGAYTIRPRSGHGKIEQFTSSAFTTPLSSFERYLNVFAARGSNLFEPRWRFERHFISYSNTAGLIRLTPLESGGHHIELLVRGWNRRELRIRTVARHASMPESAEA